MVLTFGLMLIVEKLIQATWGATEKSFLDVSYLMATLEWGGIFFSGDYTIGFILSILSLASVQIFLTRTFTGKAIRAAWQDIVASLLCGIDFNRISAITMGVSFALCAVEGICMTFVYSFYPSVHLNWLFYMFLITIVGGVGSIKGVLAAGVIIGLLVNIVNLLVPYQWITVIIFILLVGILLYKPTGLFQS